MTAPSPESERLDRLDDARDLIQVRPLVDRHPVRVIQHRALEG